MSLRRFPAVLFLGALLLTSCSEDPVFQERDTVYIVADQPQYSAKVLNDRYWLKTLRIVFGGRIFWSRTKIDILETPEPFQPYGIRLEVYGEYEVFWDGVQIGKNGNPGQEHLLEPEGKLWATFSIPTDLTEKGEHVLAIRTSLHYFPDHVRLRNLEIDDYDTLLTAQLIKTSYLHIFAGAFLITSLYFIFLFLSDRKEYAMLVFSISCFLFFALTMTEFIRTTVPIHYSLHHIRFEIIGVLMFGISFMIPLFFSMQFPFPKRIWALSIYAVILSILFYTKHDYFDLTPSYMAISTWFFSSGIVLYAVYKREKGALIVLLILLLSILLQSFTTFDISMYVVFSLILLGMFYLLTLKIKEQRLAYEYSLVQSTRLRLELLKKNIQPHFLMNTLTSLMDWVEEAPNKGVLFIEALAKEFDLFNQIEDQTLIPITQEIALCRTHMEIMTYRKEVNYSWKETGIDAEEKIPPAILHTLLENGITHSLPLENNQVQFELIYESNHDHKRYRFLTFANSVKQNPDKIKEGTGLKYIKARLTESYQSNWEFTSEPTRHGWENVIKIYKG